MSSIPVGFFQAHLLYKPVAGPRMSSIGVGINWTGSGTIPTPTEMATIVDIAASNSDSIAPPVFMSSDWSYQGVDVTYETETGPLSGQFLHSVIGIGTAGALPPNSAILVNKVTALGGRRNRGRLFLPPVYPAETIVDSLGVLNSTAVTNLQARFDAFKSRLALADAHIVLFHGEAPFTPTAVTNFVVQPLLATQRRRMRR